MRNSGDYHYGFQCGAKQLKNMTDYERCALFQLIKFVRSRMKRKKSRPLCNVTIFLTQATNTFCNLYFVIYM